jgi:hypothetical protein
MPSLLHKVTKGQMWLDIEHKKCKQCFCEQTALEAATWPNTMMKILKVQSNNAIVLTQRLACWFQMQTVIQININQTTLLPAPANR